MRRRTVPRSRLETFRHGAHRLVVAVLAGAACGAFADETIRFGLHRHPEAEDCGWSEALATGLDRQAGLGVELVSGSPDRNSRLRVAAGESELAMGSAFGRRCRPGVARRRVGRHAALRQRRAVAMSAVPVVDLAPFLGGDDAARRQVARAFGDAFEHTGFAVVVNHGVCEDLVGRVYGQARDFFALPMAAKARLTPPEQVKARGYLAMGVETVAATLAGGTPPDLCEALVFASLQRERSGLGKPNLWPDAPAGFAESIHAWFDAVHALCGRLMRLAALALALPEDWFAPSFAEPAITLRFVNYPDQRDAPAPGQLRYGAHHDYGGLTLLRQDDAPGGLEICDREGLWRPMPPVPGSFVINVGDLMQRWTNGRWRSTLHRVVNPPRALTGSSRRLSMVAFTGPAESTTVRCLPTCQGPGNPPRFEPVVAGDYVRAKLAASME